MRPCSARLQTRRAGELIGGPLGCEVGRVLTMMQTFDTTTKESVYGLQTGARAIKATLLP